MNLDYGIQIDVSLNHKYTSYFFFSVDILYTISKTKIITESLTEDNQLFLFTNDFPTNFWGKESFLKGHF